MAGAEIQDNTELRYVKLFYNDILQQYELITQRTLRTISMALRQLSRILPHFFAAISSLVAIQVPPTQRTASFLK
jgi:hypothetical protein